MSNKPKLSWYEPLFHHPELGVSSQFFEQMTHEDFWEVGASGQKYKRTEVLQTVKERYQDVNYSQNDTWECSNFLIKEITKDFYLITYVLYQSKFTRKTCRSSIWRWDHDHWKVLYHQGTPCETVNREDCNMKTIFLPEQYDYLALDNTEIRLLLEQAHHGGIAHGTMLPNSISEAITHKTVFETWFILSGTGKMWRKFGEQQRLDKLEPNTIIDMPLGVEYQFASDDEPLVFLIVTMPPWPGADEAVLLTDQNWQSRLDKFKLESNACDAPLLLKSVPDNYQHTSPARAEVRLLSNNQFGGIAHCTLKKDIVSKAVTHKTVSEFWYVLSGTGQIWRKNSEQEIVTKLVKNVCIDIPLGAEFQYRADGEDLVSICVTMPPWSGADEARYVDAPYWIPSNND
jgi:mannose-6-phosphate isomerase-like protein (cupin superfamily)